MMRKTYLGWIYIVQMITGANDTGGQLPRKDIEHSIILEIDYRNFYRYYDVGYWIRNP